MTYDLDEAVDRLMPWDLTVKILGKELKTRRPTVAEFGALQALGSLSDEEGTKLLQSLFDPPIDYLHRFGTARIQGFIIAYFKYFNGRAMNQSGDIAAEVRKALRETFEPSAKAG